MTPEHVFVAHFVADLDVWMPLTATGRARQDGIAAGTTTSFSEFATMYWSDEEIAEGVEEATVRWLEAPSNVGPPPGLDCELPDLRLVVTAADAVQVDGRPRLDGCPVVTDVLAQTDAARQPIYTLRLVNRARYPILVTFPAGVVAKPYLGVLDPVNWLRQTVWGWLGDTYGPGGSRWRSRPCCAGSTACTARRSWSSTPTSCARRC